MGADGTAVLMHTGRKDRFGWLDEIVVSGYFWSSLNVSRF